MNLTPQERARRIKVILFDVDGVLTDGGIWVIPATPHDRNAVALPAMIEAKGFSAHDGAGITLARLGGMKCGVITKRISDTVAIRCRDLKIEHVYQGAAHKMQAVREIMAEEKVTLEEIAYVGDDIIDLPVLRQCGLAVAVANARAQVKAVAHYVTPNSGGYGAARDAIEFILEAKGLLEQAVERFLDESSPLPAAMDIGRGGDLS